MIGLLHSLPDLSSTITEIIATSSSQRLREHDADAYIRAIKRKAEFARMHLSVLEGIKWQEVDEIGRMQDVSKGKRRLTVPLREATLELHHPGAVTDHVYVAFDGLTAALTNISDTLARLLNAVYGFGIPERGATLLAVRDKCSRSSTLGTILYDPQYTDWLYALRELRGRCQHADVEDVLATNACVYAQRPEPLVSREYAWGSIESDMPIVAYARNAMNASEATLNAAVSAIIENPNNPAQ